MSRPTNGTLATSTIAQRTQATRAAIGSVRAEGLEPSKATLQRLEAYAAGTLTADELHKQTLQEVRELAAGSNSTVRT